MRSLPIPMDTTLRTRRILTHIRLTVTSLSLFVMVVVLVVARRRRRRRACVCVKTCAHVSRFNPAEAYRRRSAKCISHHASPAASRSSVGFTHDSKNRRPRCLASRL